MSVLGYKYNDGGRKDAGFKGDTGDCVTRAISIVTRLDYRDVYDELNRLTREMTGGLYRSVRDGCTTPVTHRFLTEQGYTLSLRSREYLGETYTYQDEVIAVMARHWCAVIDDVVQDTWDCRTSKRTKNGLPLLVGSYS